MPSDLALPNVDLVNSWKEIALYLGRGVRTVQRWEHELGLPVRRPHGKSRSAVIALKPELDRWLRVNCNVDLGVARRRRAHQKTSILAKTHQLLTRSRDLCARSQALSEQLNLSVTLAISKIQGNKKAATDPPRV